MKKKSDLTALSKNLILPVLINRNSIFTLLQLLFGRFIKIHLNILGKKSFKHLAEEVENGDQN